MIQASDGLGRGERLDNTSFRLQRSQALKPYLLRDCYMRIIGLLQSLCNTGFWKYITLRK